MPRGTVLARCAKSCLWCCATAIGQIVMVEGDGEGDGDGDGDGREARFVPASGNSVNEILEMHQVVVQVGRDHGQPCSCRKRTTDT